MADEASSDSAEEATYVPDLAKLKRALRRFDALITGEPNTGCWLWLGSVNNKGYGQMHLNGRTVTAHRFAYERFIGEIPTGLCILHKCDTPSCCNPLHLRTGSQAENLADSRSKSRHAYGVKNGHAKLTEADVRSILGSPLRHVDLARKYGVTDENIIAIRKRKSWAHVRA